ncbi:hypothetical protein PCANB_002145 [Pneumocystis canis]|nr:hypothetical protein PCANB_002145 [Pneumocystis canis]
MNTLIKESERLLTQLSTAPTLAALESYIQQLQYAKQFLEDTKNGLHLSTEAILRPELICAATQVTEAQKDVQIAIQRYGRILDKQFRADLSAVHVHEQFPGDSKQLHSAIGMYLIRQAAFDITQTFMKETQLDLPEHLLQAFKQLYCILNALRNENFEMAIDPKNHQIAINYARTHFPAFADRYLKEIKQLMCLFCYASNMSLFPYKQLYTPEYLWTSIQASFNREYCSLIGFSPDSPLQTVSIAGSLAIPTLLKMSSIMKEKKTEWTSQNELPVEIPLPSKYQFHSVFTCPISKEQTTESNPPLMIPCGHVISKNSIERLSKDNPTNKFKCPYCPRETTPQEAILLYL